jgi:hypothetical protein
VTDAPQDSITPTQPSPAPRPGPSTVSGPMTLDLLERRLRITQQLAAHRGQRPVAALGALIEHHTGTPVSEATARALWADLMAAGWIDPAEAVEPVATGIFPSLEVELLRARCLNCGEPFNGVIQVEGVDHDHELPGRTISVLHVRLVHDCPAARKHYQQKRARGEA